MESEVQKLSISESIGSVSTKLTVGDTAEFIMVLAHGAGAGMDHIFMEQLAKALAELGIVTLRFNFPFAENKKGRPDFPPVAEKTICIVSQKAKALYPELPLIVAGKSFGGRMSSNLLAKDNTVGARALVFFGFPLHPPGKPGTGRADHLASVTIPMLFLQGTKDTLADLDVLRRVTDPFPLATLEIIEGADHAFKAGKRQVIPGLASETFKWLKAIP